jgi:hypothetical protein
MTEQQRFNIRSDYRQCLSDYVRHLPPSIRRRNLLFADQEARILRDLFAADADILPPAFASRLKAMLQAHMAVRVFYPSLERFYDDVRYGRTGDPLPLDAVEKITALVDSTPEVFDSSVGNAISDTAPTLPDSTKTSVESVSNHAEILPPPDPLGTLPTEKAQAYTRAGTINRLWAVFQTAETLNKNSDAWIKMGSQLLPHVRPILNWLSDFVSSGPPPVP